MNKLHLKILLKKIIDLLCKIFTCTMNHLTILNTVKSNRYQLHDGPSIAIKLSNCTTLCLVLVSTVFSILV